MGDVKREIVDAAARAFYVTAWAEREEERGRARGWGGRDLMDIAPRTSPKAKVAGKRFIANLEAANKGTAVGALYVMAATAPGKHYKEPSPEDFGHTMAMQAMGHGVSWWDDHPHVPITVPHYEFTMFDL